MSLKPTGAYFIDHLIHDCIGLLLFWVSPPPFTCYGSYTWRVSRKVPGAFLLHGVKTHTVDLYSKTCPIITRLTDSKRTRLHFTDILESCLLVQEDFRYSRSKEWTSYSYQGTMHPNTRFIRVSIPWRSTKTEIVERYFDSTLD